MAILQLVFGLIILAITLTVPGYCLTLAFFPRKTELEELERFAFSFVFSMTFLPLLVLIENQILQIPINALTATASVLFLVAVGLLVWYYRTRSMKKEEAVAIWFPKLLGKK
jgi:uncharacterized membrane protein